MLKDPAEITDILTRLTILSNYLNYFMLDKITFDEATGDEELVITVVSPVKNIPLAEWLKENRFEYLREYEAENGIKWKYRIRVDAERSTYPYYVECVAEGSVWGEKIGFTTLKEAKKQIGNHISRNMFRNYRIIDNKNKVVFLAKTETFTT